MKKQIFIIVLIYFAAPCKSEPRETHNNGMQSDQKLSVNTQIHDSAGPYFPKNIAAQSYHLWIAPVPEENTFKGQIDIIISCLIPTRYVKLHAGKLLHIGHVDVRECVGNPRNGTCDYRLTNNLSVQEVNRREPEFWCEVIFSDNMKKGMLYKLSVLFFGELLSDTIENGLYKGKYTQDDNDKRWFVAAHLHPNKARNVFPCLDDFPHKANFKISIGRAKNQTAISLMPIYESEDMPDGKHIWDHFHTTPLMAPFSFNLYIFDPEAIQLIYSANGSGSTKIHIYGRPAIRDDLQQIGRKVLQVLTNIETYLQQKYPLPVLQIVISPNLLATYSGFGLITVSEEDRIACYWLLKLSFDVASQWFFHLTSPNSWSQTALGDSISKYVAIAASHGVLKDTVYSNSISWGALYVQATMSLSFEERARPFDNIRNVWTIRLLNNTLSEQTLRLGLTSFLNARLYKTYTSSGILRYLNKQVRKDNVLPTGISLQLFAKSWLNAEHLPQISAIRNYERGKIHIKQQIFKKNKSRELSDDDVSHRWYMPIELIWSDQLLEEQQNETKWMMGTESIVIGNMTKSDAFVIVDPEANGLCIVNYDEINWALIKSNLHENQSLVNLSATSRAKLLTDSYLLASAGELPFNVTFDMTLMLLQETHYEPWYAFREIFANLSDLIQRTRLKPQFEMYVRWLLTPSYEQCECYGVEENFEESKVQDLVLSIMCDLGAEDCIEAFTDQIVPGNEMNCNVLKWGNYSTWNESLYMALHNPAVDLLKMLAKCTNKKERLDQLLENMLFNEKVNRSTALDVVEAVKEPYILFNFVSNNWFRIKNKYNDDGKIFLKTLVYMSTSEFGSADGEVLVRNFYAARKTDTPDVLLTLDTALQRIADRRPWYDRALPQIESWLQHSANQTLAT